MRSTGKEAVVVCGDHRSTVTGIMVFDVDTGEELLRIPGCAAAANGLLFFSDHSLVASQVAKHGSSGSGSIITWPINKPRSSRRSYTMEAIEPLCCTRDGAYLAAGAVSGNVYLWEAASGKLLKTWTAHRKSVRRMTFSDDGSFLVSGSHDGMILVWSMIRLLDIDNCESFLDFPHCSYQHSSSITGLLTKTTSTSLTFVSSSMDGRCKVWDLISGSLVRTRDYGQAISAIALHPLGELLFAGSLDGSIFLDAIGNAAFQDYLVSEQDQTLVLKGHNESITALTFCKTGLISASNDCTVCIWDVESRQIIRRLIHQKGPVTNLVIIPQSALYCGSDSERGSNKNHVYSFDKYSKPMDSTNDVITRLPLLSSNQTCLQIKRNCLSDHCLLESEQESYAATMEMKVETTMDRRTWATNMGKHVVEMNRHIQMCLVDMMKLRLWTDEFQTSSVTTKRKMKEKNKNKNKHQFKNEFVESSIC